MSTTPGLDGKREFVVGDKTFRAAGSMPCADRRAQVPHEAHVWDKEHALYGPYFCEGVAGSAPVTPPVTEQVSRHAVEVIIDATLASSFDGANFCYDMAVERLRSIGIEVTE